MVLIVIFINGYFAKFSWKKVAKVFALYVVFQLLYICYLNIMFDSNLIYQIIIPEWLMWYLLVYLFNLCLVPLLDYERKTYSMLEKYAHITTFLIIVVVLYFLCPYLVEYGEIFSILRFFTFLPYFVIGYYFKKIIGGTFDIIFKSKKIKYIFRSVFLVLIIISTCIIVFSNKITTLDLYGAYPSKDLYSLIIRLVLLFCSFSWVGFFLITLRINKKIPIITRIGGNTISVFLLHGFVLKLLVYYNLFGRDKMNVVVIMLTALSIVFLLGIMNVNDLKKLIFKSKCVC